MPFAGYCDPSFSGTTHTGITLTSIGYVKGGPKSDPVSTSTETRGCPDNPYDGRYQGQRGPTRIIEDKRKEGENG